jgi:hypothetical protein
MAYEEEDTCTTSTLDGGESHIGNPTLCTLTHRDTDRQTHTHTHTHARTHTHRHTHQIIIYHYYYLDGGASHSGNL